MLCQLGPRGASSDAGAQRTTRDKYDASVGCSAAKGPGRLRDDRLFSSDDITILVHGKWGFATTVLGGFIRRVGEIWVAAEEHSGSVKRSLRAGLAWKKRGNGSVASARDAKTGISRFGDHSGALPVRRGRNPCF